MSKSRGTFIAARTVPILHGVTGVWSDWSITSEMSVATIACGAAADAC